MVSSLTINNKEVQSLTINNKEVQSIVRVSDNTVLYEKQTTISTINTTITLNSSNTSALTNAMCFISNIDGYLKDENNNPLNDKTVKIFWDNNPADYRTVTTDSSGYYSKSGLKVGDCAGSIFAPLTAGSHTLNALFEGDENYNESIATVTITIIEKTGPGPKI